MNMGRCSSSDWFSFLPAMRRGFDRNTGLIAANLDDRSLDRV